MKKISLSLLITTLLIVTTSCSKASKKPNQTPQNKHNTPTQLVGGGCDGCEIMYEGMPKTIPSVDTSAGWHESRQKLLVKGTVYQLDATTPAPNVIIYYWHTDANGLYSQKKESKNNAALHGYLRGWVKTDALGKYAIYTLRPAPYPKETLPAHIHFSIKEPGLQNEYYTDDLVFEDDTLLTKEKRNALENRGGSGIVKVTTSNDVQTAMHTIILGRNIPNHPTTLIERKNE
jgi:protocatechuate 3,4-dioxygenase beta subunit